MKSSFRICVFATVFVLTSAEFARSERIALVAGGGKERGETLATKAQLDQPFGIDFDRSGNMFVVEMTGNRVLKVDRQGILTTIAGTGEKGETGDGGPAARARFNGMHSLAVARNGDVYVADTWNNCVRRIDAKTGTITTFAGTGTKGFRGDDGPAAKAQFGGTYCLAFDPQQENLYIADLDNRRIRAVNSKTAIVRTVAGNGKRGVPEDGADARMSPLLDPRAVAVDAKGNVYILERAGHALRVVDPSGKIRTVVGTGKAGLVGDGGNGRSATLNGPKHLCIDPDGNVLIADTENHVIRKYLPGEGKVVRVAGTGKRGHTGLGGSPLEAELNAPHGVYVHASGTLYIADSSNHRILKIER